MNYLNNEIEILEIDNEILEVDGEKLVFFILDEYDGVKQEVNLDKNILLLWYDYKDSYEEWFFIEAKRNILEKYLSNEIGILTLMKKSRIKIVHRYYENYNSIVTTSEVLDLNKTDKELPDDVKIGENLLIHLFANNLTSIQLNIQKQFDIKTQPIPNELKNLLITEQYKYNENKSNDIIVNNENESFSMKPIAA